MTHLCLHVVEKLTIYGSMHVKWMYPIECVLKTLKAYVRNKEQLKALMVERYIYDKKIKLLLNTCKSLSMFNIEYEMQMKKKGYVMKCSKPQDLSFF